MANHQVKDTVDLTKDLCPITFVKIKLKLEELKPGEIIEVILKDGEPLESVSHSVEREGHKIVAREKISAGIQKLIIMKGAE